MAGWCCDAIAGRRVIFEVFSGDGQDAIIEAGDGIRVIAKVSMSQADYAGFTTADIVIY